MPIWEIVKSLVSERYEPAAQTLVSHGRDARKTPILSKVSRTQLAVMDSFLAYSRSSFQQPRSLEPSSRSICKSMIVLGCCSRSLAFRLLYHAYPTQHTATTRTSCRSIHVLLQGSYRQLEDNAIDSKAQDFRSPSVSLLPSCLGL